MIKSYRKKPVVIEAVKWTGKNISEIFRFAGNAACDSDYGLVISTLEGNMMANKGDFIIKGIRGEFYPCAAEIFKETYEEVKEAT